MCLAAMSLKLGTEVVLAVTVFVLKRRFVQKAVVS